ncbi:MAG: hypothetical protein MH204_04985, partial [Fimbriimonadaceae bacterium]|nr:hypothetical protein [Fimbriimonadaceae bacterium]
FLILELRNPAVGPVHAFTGPRRSQRGPIMGCPDLTAASSLTMEAGTVYRPQVGKQGLGLRKCAGGTVP